MHDQAGASASVPVGNTYDKYGSTNPVTRRLMRGFTADLDHLLGLAGPQSLLDVGCGEGVLTAEWAQRFERVVGVDLEHPALRREWEERASSNLEFRAAQATALPFDADEFDLVCAIEVLEHVPDPHAALAEMARVARSFVLVSVPREPLWRGLNLLRGAYWRSLGNTPGHLNHWSARGLQTLAARYGRVVERRSPVPWTMVLLDVG
ncbi:MAG TPA: class I SAM-dependent methyltransferase [Gaiellaceae bacterium]